MKIVVPIVAASFGLHVNCLSLDTLRVGISLGSSAHNTCAKSLTYNEKTKFKKPSHYASVFVGYDHLIKETPIFLGVEAEVSNHKAEKSKDGYFVTPATFKISTNNSITGSLRMGTVIKNILLYGKTGISSTNWKTTFEGNNIIQHKRYQKYGSLIGGGIECILNKNFSFSFEHTFTNYNTIEKIPPDTQLKLSPAIQTTSLRLIYNF